MAIVPRGAEGLKLNLCSVHLASPPRKQGTFSSLHKGAIWVSSGPQLIQHGKNLLLGLTEQLKDTAVICPSSAPKQLPFALCFFSLITLYLLEYGIKKAR